MKQVLTRIYGHGRGYVFSPKDFLDITDYSNAQKTLSRLAQQGTIRRLMRGVYEYPAFSKLLNAPASPDPDAIARAVARSRGWTITPTGNTALHLLGLSTQVSAQWEFYSDGPSRTYRWEGGQLSFKHRAIKETSALSPMTAMLVQALKALGARRISPSMLNKLKKTLNARERERALREARYTTSWVYDVIKQLADEDEAAE